MIAERLRAAYEASAADLARGALGVLRGAGGTAVVADHLEAAQAGPPMAAAAGGVDAGGVAAAVSAVRVLGADVLAPYVLVDQRLPPEESAAVCLCVSALPPVRQSPAAPPGGPEAPWIRAWIDWGLVTVLAGLDPAARPAAAVVPQQPPRCDDSAPRHRTGGGSDGDGGEGWVPWSLRMGQLASLALPGLDSPVHHLARCGVLALARGATRAVLRRDFATAARITRWLAWLAADGVPLPVNVSLLVREIALRGHDGGRCTLDLAIARRLLGEEGP